MWHFNPTISSSIFHRIVIIVSGSVENREKKSHWQLKVIQYIHLAIADHAVLFRQHKDV